MKTLELSNMTPIAIMPGGNPLGTPTGISPDLEEKVARFHAQHGTLPIIVLIPRELRPRQALSWQAFFAPAPQGSLTIPEGLPRRPSEQAQGGQSIGAITSPRGQGGDNYQKRPRGCLPAGRPRAIGAEVDREIASLGAKGLGAESIVKILRASSVQVSERTVARRLAAQQGRLSAGDPEETQQNGPNC